MSFTVPVELLFERVEWIFLYGGEFFVVSMVSAVGRFHCKYIIRGRTNDFAVDFSKDNALNNSNYTLYLRILCCVYLGTSTFDGMAIACATLRYFIEDAKSFTLFVSHYPIFKTFEQNYVTCSGYHMAFLTTSCDNQCDNESSVTNDDGDETSIVFLYKLVKGLAGKSYGLNVARLARIKETIIARAAIKSQEMEKNLQNQQ